MERVKNEKKKDDIDKGCLIDNIKVTKDRDKMVWKFLGRV